MEHKALAESAVRAQGRGGATTETNKTRGLEPLQLLTYEDT